ISPSRGEIRWVGRGRLSCGVAGRSGSSARAVPRARPSGLPAISPTRGEISCFTFLPILQRRRLAEASLQADLPPCGGDGLPARGGRGGRELSPASRNRKAALMAAYILRRLLLMIPTL